MLKDYFARSVLVITLLTGIPALTLIGAAGGVICSMSFLYSGGIERLAAGGALPPTAIYMWLDGTLWRVISAFGLFLGARVVFLLLRLRWNIFLSQAAAGVGTFLVIRYLYGILGVFNTILSVWSVVMFVAFLAVFDSLEPERGERWRGIFRSLLTPAFRGSRWRR
ncbi:MAG: hypothetical protein LBT65_07315 [Synergistaceae bacterium]|jgi:hypothetical protein|nr:hypothetical protein [Synergistaceae bacterium]